MNKPSEWWIAQNGVAFQAPTVSFSSDHVIEYAAYETMLKRAETAEAALLEADKIVYAERNKVLVAEAEAKLQRADANRISELATSEELEKVRVLREALEWYASREAWTTDQVEGSHGDYGNKARVALEKTKL